jgi:hypothetical protein
MKARANNSEQTKIEVRAVGQEPWVTDLRIVKREPKD